MNSDPEISTPDQMGVFDAAVRSEVDRIYPSLRRQHSLSDSAGNMQPMPDPYKQAKYLAYLRSPEWRRRRNAILQRADGWCERCGHVRATEVHHLTYVRLGDERPDDLLALCAFCHRAEHGKPERLEDCRRVIQAHRNWAANREWMP